VQGKPEAAGLKEWEADWTRKGVLTPQLVLKELKTESKGEGATATFTAEVTYPDLGKATEAESIELTRELDVWTIVPFTLDGLQKHLRQSDTVQAVKQFATMTVHPGLYLSMQAKNRMEACRSNLKRIGTGLVVLADANKGKLALKADRFKAAVNAYTRNESLFHCPEQARTAAKVVSYSFNAQLEGKVLDAIKNPEQVVLAYEGRGGKLDFRHDGKAVVAFADGHVSLVSETQKVLWR
jgi:prepilin-type processing-associated H-X9-DG protein